MLQATYVARQLTASGFEITTPASIAMELFGCTPVGSAAELERQNAKCNLAA